MKKYFFVVLMIGMLIIPAESEEKWYGVYFTSPGKKYLNRNNPQNALSSLLKKSQKSIDCALFELSCPVIASDLISAKKKGVKVRVVIDDRYYGKKAVSRLIKNGIPVKTDKRRGLMHNKFVVIDGTVLWTGSYNTSRNGAYKNNNNAIAICSEDLCSIYTLEFNEMFQQGVFGNRKETRPFGKLTQKYYVKINATDINAYFSPDNNVESIIVKRLKKARKSVHFMAFSFTSDAIGKEMIKLHKKGVKVTGLFEKRGAKTRYSEYTKMKLAGIPVKLDRNRYAMHHKVIVIDGKKVITGSYNFSKSANKKNDENIIIIDNADIANQYLDEFKRLY